MAKTKTPFLSLGSSGSIGNAITSQKRGSQTLLRAKPEPAYRRTLPQRYQRWLYEDYAYLFTQQNEATRRSYAASGSKYHLTAFQYWMKYHLTNMHDIAGLWHLDTIAAGITLDSSRNENHATIFGATPVTGRIDQALSFDGLNDYGQVTQALSLEPPTTLTLECFLTPTTLSNWQRIFSKGIESDPYHGYSLLVGATQLYFQLFAGADLKERLVNHGMSTGITYHIVALYDGTNMSLYKDGSLLQSWATTGAITHNTAIDLFIGRHNVATQHLKATLDELRIYNRALLPADITRHSLRRAPS